MRNHDFEDPPAPGPTASPRQGGQPAGGLPTATHLRARMPCIALGGPRGVGKTTVLSALQRLQSDVNVVHVSRELTKLAGLHGVERFRTLPPALKVEIRAEFARTQVEAVRESSRPTIFDLHYIDVDEGTNCIQPHELLEHVDAFVLLEADLPTVLERRRTDASRNRSLDPLRVIQEHEAELVMMRALASRYSRPHFQIENDGAVADAAHRILHLIEHLSANPSLPRRT